MSSTIHREVLKFWILTGVGQTKQSVIFFDIRKQTLWGNTFITFPYKQIIFEKWIKNGTIYLKTF